MTTSEIVLVLLVGAAAALLKSITGVGYPLTLLPMLALFMDVSDAVVIVAPSNLFLNVKLVWGMQDERKNTITLPRFLAGGCVGVVIGALALPHLRDETLRWVIVGFIMVFLLNQLTSKALVISEPRGQTLAPWVGSVTGFFQGATGLSGPIVIPWFMSLGLRRDTYIFAVSAVFGLTGLLQIVVFAVQGLFTVELVWLGAALIPMAQLVFPFGKVIRERVSVEAFRRIVLVLLAGSAVSLVARML
jgi:uncharacterized membrane protein YfcA